MAVSRGSIHHSFREDFSYLITSLFDSKICCRAKKNTKDKTTDLISSYFDSKNVVLTPYARTSLYLILKALNIPSGSEILMTPFNISPMLDVIEELGLKPIFIDINLTDYGPKYDDLDKCLSKKPACFILTYLFGYVPNVKLISDYCKKYKVHLIEDFSQNIGSSFQNKLLGKFGLASIYSASLTKYVDSYSGSFIISNEDIFVDKIKEISNSFLNTNPKRIKKIILTTLLWNIALSIIIFSIFIYPGLFLLKVINPKIFERLIGTRNEIKRLFSLPNYYFEDISEIQCIVMKKKLKKLEKLISSRNKLVKRVNLIVKNNYPKYYKKNLIKLLSDENYYHSFWQFIIKVKNTEKAKEILFDNFIETGITKLPNLSNFYEVKLENAIKLKSEYIFMPLHDFKTDKATKRFFKILSDNDLLN